jgi:hypothetical protein
MYRKSLEDANTVGSHKFVRTPLLEIFLDRPSDWTMIAASCSTRIKDETSE